jgi:hypothetical protein
MPLETWVRGAATTPCAYAKRPYKSRNEWSKLHVMDNGATNHDAERPSATNRITEADRDESASHQLGATNRETRRLGQRHTVKEAAEVLGTTIDAIRGRIRRGTLDSVKLDGVVYVLLDATNREEQSDQSETGGVDGRQLTGNQAGLTEDQSELVGDLRDQIDWLRREVERKDTIIMSLTQRIPELEAPLETRDASETASHRSDRGTDQEDSQEHVERRSWWRRFFGIE